MIESLVKATNKLSQIQNTIINSITFMLSKFLDINPTHPKSSKRHFLLGKKSALLETGNFTSSKGAKLLPGKKYRPYVLNIKDQRKCMVYFEDKGMFSKVHWRILEDSGRFLSQNTKGLGLKASFYNQTKHKIYVTTHTYIHRGNVCILIL